jgi:protein-disulfide isomerase
VRSKGGPRTRQASPKALAIGGAVVVLAAIGIGLAFAFSGGGSSGIPSGTPTVGTLNGALPGATDIQQLYGGIPQQGLTLGKPDAPVRVVMFIDLQCPFCRDFEVNSMPTIVNKYVRTGKVRIDLKPLAFIGTDSIKARKALIAASYQDKAYNFAGVLYDNQQTENTGWVTDSMLAQIAASVPGLNVEKVFAQRNSQQTTQIAKQAEDAGSADKIAGTPTVLVGAGVQKPKDVSPSGQVPTLAQVTSAIDAALGQ